MFWEVFKVIGLTRMMLQNIRNFTLNLFQQIFVNKTVYLYYYVKYVITFKNDFITVGSLIFSY